MLAAVPFIHPAQGLFRDWDDFAATGCALSLVVAWLIGETLRGASNRRWIAVPVVASVMMSALQGLAHSTDVDQGMRRVRAFALEAPPRTDIERAGVWDFLGIRNYRLDRYHAAADAYAHAADYAPSPRLLQQLALAETMAGNLERAQEVYHRLLMKDPNNTSGWLGLGAVASRIPDPDDSFRAARKVLELEPNHVGGHQLLDYLRKTYPGRDTVGAGR
ncbi:MAG: hypothetical protein HYR73_06420 [Candidatus Eisenbacteria bacterium]|nr:hypothetical protein [Candidatus Eisenbacteria bacterium]